MADYLDKWLEENYVLDQRLNDNPGARNLLKLIGADFTLKIGERPDVESRVPQRPQKIYVAPIGRVGIGLWPIEGPVEEILLNSNLDELVRSGVVSIAMASVYKRHDILGEGIFLRISESASGRVKRKLGIDSLPARYYVGFYLQPRKQQ